MLSLALEGVGKVDRHDCLPLAVSLDIILWWLRGFSITPIPITPSKALQFDPHMINGSIVGIPGA